MIQIEHTTVLYFFSSLAQSSAALAALVAVFAVFRLQSNDQQVSARYLEAHHWLEQNLYRNQVMHLPRSLVRELLSSAVGGKGQLWVAIDAFRPSDKARLLDEVKSMWRKIQESETVHGQLVLQLTTPLALWGALFFLSMVLIAVSKALAVWMDWLAIGVSLVLLLFTAWHTRRFMQSCLTSPSEGQPT